LSQLLIEVVTQSRLNLKTKATQITLDTIITYYTSFTCCIFIYNRWNK